MADTIVLWRTGQAPLRVRGELLARSESSWDTADPEHSGSTGRCEDVRIYRTASGKYVVAIHHRTQWEGEHDTNEAAVLPSLRQCVDYLADKVPGWMLQELIETLGEEAVAEEVE